jgi:HPt (histidine-containing phosphotransfer) domain-containing protein
MMVGRSSVDPVYLQDLAASGGEALVRDIVRTFLDTVPPRLTALHAALRRGDHHGVALAAHSIVSSAAMVGLIEVQEAARAIELVAAQGGPVPPAGITALDQALAAAPALLDEMMRDVLTRPAGGTGTR